MKLHNFSGFSRRAAPGAGRRALRAALPGARAGPRRDPRARAVRLARAVCNTSRVEVNAFVRFEGAAFRVVEKT